MGVEPGQRPLTGDAKKLVQHPEMLHCPVNCSDEFNLAKLSSNLITPERFTDFVSFGIRVALLDNEAGVYCFKGFA